MTQETAWLDYTKPPPGYRISGPPSQQSLTDAAIAEAWPSYKREHDPPGFTVRKFRFGVGWVADVAVGIKPTAESTMVLVDDNDSVFVDACAARVYAWAWHDRRRAIVVDIDDQLFSKGKELSAWMTIALAWTDAECAEVEAYAALPFPRGIDMPHALQRVLLPRGVHTS